MDVGDFWLVFISIEAAGKHGGQATPLRWLYPGCHVCVRDGAGPVDLCAPLLCDVVRGHVEPSSQVSNQHLQQRSFTSLSLWFQIHHPPDNITV